MNNEKLQSLYGDVPILKQFSETVLRSMGSSLCFLMAVYKSVMTGDGCSIFTGVDWKACVRTGKMKTISKRIIKANEDFRKANLLLINELKEIIAEHITEKTCFDEEDARKFSNSVEERYSTSSLVCDGLLDLTEMLDLFTGKNESRFRRQLNNLQNRISELESILKNNQELNHQLSDKNYTPHAEKIIVNKDFGKLSDGSRLKIELSREWSSQACEYLYK